MKRRDAITAGTAWLLAGDAALAHDTALDDRTLRLRAAEGALERGDTALAAAAFERAAETEHELDIELGIVRSAMQAGRYRSALQFAAHTAGAHAEAAEGAVLYAWLLAVGGQAALAHRVLAQAEARLPRHTLIGLARDALAATIPPPQATWLGTGVRLAPYSPGKLPPGARIVATGFRVPGSDLALVPSKALPNGARIWTRNGLGLLASMRIERTMDALGLTVLRVTDARAGGPTQTQAMVLAEHDPFPGAPATTIQHAESDTTSPAWPWLHHGFLGAPDASGTRQLGIDLPPGSHGGPVFDSAGRWIGIAIGAAREADPPRLVLPSMLREHLPEATAATAMNTSVTPTGRMPADAIYERAMGLVLQVVCEA